MRNLVIISGNIASGKTTLIEKLRLERWGPGVGFVPEPTDEWRNVLASDGESFFDKMYKNTHPQSAFHFQLVAIVTRVTLLRKAIQENPETNVFVCERSAAEDCKVFSKMFLDSNRMTQDECTMINLLLEQWNMCIDGITYYANVDEPPTICYERLLGRLGEGVRPSESAIKLEYLQKLSNAYESFYSEIPPQFLLRNASLEAVEDLLDRLTGNYRPVAK